MEAPRPRNERTVSRRKTGDLYSQARLADPRFTRKQANPSAARQRVGERTTQLRDLPLASDEGTRRRQRQSVFAVGHGAKLPARTGPVERPSQRARDFTFRSRDSWRNLPPQ